mmetsp:Transcript_1257/g.2126  ORF Transcript_1257/g.2126 Transcript_1257/m.2126 type:complete len:203 (+) Transcript_1257:2168-2776(+)
MEVKKVEDDLVLTQEAYAKRILADFKMQDCKGVTTPMAPSVRITKDEEGPGSDQERYRSIVGKIAYLATCTRPDLAYTVSKLSRYLNNPKRSHMLAVMYALRYIKRTSDYGLRFPQGETTMEMYVDADHAGCLDTMEGEASIDFDEELSNCRIRCFVGRTGRVVVAAQSLHGIGCEARTCDSARGQHGMHQDCREPNTLAKD